ncbi:MAG: hypothetical protein ABSG50_09580 [Opitutaceae bacterium]|jgi:hypothetical protein
MPHRPFSAPAEPPAPPGPGRAGWRAALAAGLFLITAAPAFPQGLLQWLYHHEVQVITSTDIMPAGLLLRPPSPTDPVYYVAKNFGYRDFGAVMTGDKLPVPQDMMRTIVRVLAKAGYLPADARHPPTQLIIFAWGTLYRDDMPNPVSHMTPYPSNHLAMVPNPQNFNLPDTQLNYGRELRFLGGDKLGLVSEYLDDSMVPPIPGLTRIDSDAEAIRRVAAENLYVAALAGYEFPVQQPRHPKMLWRTKISCPAAGLVLADTLPPMLVIAAPYIGRETSGPVWVNASDKFKPDIRIGIPKVEEYLDSTQVPVIEKQAAPPKGGRSGK